MKKILFILTSAFVLASCNSSSTESTTSNDSTVVVVDSTKKADTTKCDTAKCKKGCDTTSQKKTK